MPTYNHFTELPVWQEAHQFLLKIYKLTLNDSFKKDLGLKDQIRRAAISITSNISEGHDRNSTKSYKYFLTVAKGSSSEVHNQLIIARDLSYCTNDEFIQLEQQVLSINFQLGGYIKYLNSKI